VEISPDLPYDFRFRHAENILSREASSESRNGGTGLRAGKALSSSAWFSHLSVSLQDRVRDSLVIRKLKSGEYIFRQGDKPHALYFILSGQVETIGTANDGQITLLSILRDGDWTGFFGILTERPNPFSTIASADCEIGIIPRSYALEIFGNSVENLRHLIDPLIEILRYGYRYLANTNGRSPRRVVAQRLLDLGRSVYLPDSSSTAILASINQESIATATYLTRPTVNRTLNDLANKGLIKLGYGKIEILDIARLGEIASGTAPAQLRKAHSARSAKCVAWQIDQKGTAPPRVIDILMAGGWFPALPAEIQQTIADSLIFRTVKAGEAVYLHDQPGDGLFVQIDGQSRVIQHGSDGREVLMSLLLPGEWSGFVPLIDHRGQPFSVIAARTSIVAILPRSKAEELFMQSTETMRMLIAPMLNILAYLYEYLIETNRRPPLRLVAQRLIDLSRSAYLPEVKARKHVDDLTQHDLAAATGLARPTVNRVLGDLETRGIIKLGYGRISINDPKALLSMAQSGTS
jgi:CRP-like cAMP-binding protein